MEIEELKTRLEAEHHASYCWALACCQRDPSEAEEVLQTVYLKILEGRARFRGDSSLRTWLFAVIRTTAVDRRRRQFLHGARLLRLAEQLAGRRSSENVEELFFKNQADESFHRALSSLSTRQREALHLVFYHEMSVEEAGEAMGLSTGSARTHYERGKRRMRELLERTEVCYGSGWRARANRGEVS